MSGIEATGPVPGPTGFAPPQWGGFDASRTRGQGAADLIRSFKTSARLGWQMEANWTDPLLFFIYSVAKPVSSALILVFMLEVITGGAGPNTGPSSSSAARSGPSSSPGSPGSPGPSSTIGSATGC